jgi:hypothetical protein
MSDSEQEIEEDAWHETNLPPFDFNEPYGRLDANPREEFYVILDLERRGLL